MKGKQQQKKKSMWKPEEDLLLKNYVHTYGEGKWSAIPNKLGLARDGKSCRLRWKNYLRPDIKHGSMSKDEQDLILRMHKLIGNRWSLIAGRLPGRTDNEVKNYWNTHLSKNSSTKRKTITSIIDDRLSPESKRPKTAGFERSTTKETRQYTSFDEENDDNGNQGESRDDEERWSSLTEEVLMTRSGAGSLSNGFMEMGLMDGGDGGSLLIYGDDEDRVWASAVWDHASYVLLDTFGGEFGLPEM